MPLETIEQYLRELSQKYDLTGFATTCCGEYLDECLREDTSGGNASLGGYSREELVLAFDRQELVFAHYLNQSPRIRIHIGLYVHDPKGVWARNLEPVGAYVLETNAQGEALDDWIIIDKEKNADINIPSHLQDLNALLSDGGLSRNSTSYEYISHVHHAISLYQSKLYDAAALFVKRADEYRNSNQQMVANQAYFRNSKRLLRMLLNYMLEKRLLSAETIKLLKESGVIKP